MALPLPRVVADVGPGGGLVSAMGGMNALANANVLRQINQIKAQYMPITSQAEAASKLAYANMMGPQFVAKMLGNPDIAANLGDSQAKSGVQRAFGAGMGDGMGGNYLANLPTGNDFSGIGQPSTNKLSGKLVNGLLNLFGINKPAQQVSPVNQIGYQPSLQNYNNQNAEPKVGDAVQGNFGDSNENAKLDAYDEWLRSPEGKAELEKGEKGKYPSPDGALDWKAKKELLAAHNPMALEINKGQTRPKEKTYAEKAGEFQGIKEQGKEAGKLRAQAQKDIGQSQLALSNSGASLHRMASIIKNPVIQDMRSKIPFFQDKQLGYLEKMGTPEQKKLIGDFITTGEQIIASGVQSFGGKPLVREFDLLQRQKINRNDPVHVAEGKLQASIALHDIAEQKNEIINDLLGQGVSEADAVKQANKMVDVGAIEKKTNELLRDKPTQDDINHMAKKYNISPEEVKKRLKAKGLL